jgi:hypothetical protein
MKNYEYKVDQEIVLFDNDEEFFGKVVDVRDNTVLCTMGDDKPIEFDKGVVIPLADVEDLFKTVELIPSDVKLVLETFDEDADTYKELARLVNELRPLGYTFSYYLDAEPYWLRKI